MNGILKMAIEVGSHLWRNGFNLNFFLLNIVVFTIKWITNPGIASVAKPYQIKVSNAAKGA